MKKHEAVQQADDNQLNNDKRVKLVIANKYEEHRSEFVNFFEEFTYMWNGHPASITTIKRGVRLTNDNVYSVYSALYRAGLTARQLPSLQIAITEWASPIVFTPKTTASFISASTTAN